jgi:cell division septum initiation protein DivIVA
VLPGKRFPARGGQVLISVDDALKDIATLKQTALTLAETASAAQRQADTAVAALTSGQGGTPTAPVASAQAQAEEASQDSQQASAAITQAIRAGDYRVLETQSRTLNTSARDSIAARSRVIRSY